MAAGFPTKANWATGDVLTAAQMNDLAGTTNLLAPTAKGSIKAGSAANTLTDIAVGANGTVLTADSTATGGVKWASAASGGMTLLSTTSLSGSSVTISSISGSYKHLYGVIYGATNATSNSYVKMATNGSANSVQQWMSGGGISTSVNTGFYLIDNQYASTRTDTNRIWNFTIYDYANTSYYKAVECFFQDGAANNAFWNNGYYQTNSAINSLTFTLGGGQSFSTGTILLYGVS